MDTHKILNQILYVLGEIELLLNSNRVPGPYTRTRAYEFKKLLPNSRVFQFRDVLTSYYVVDVSSAYGQRLYADLWSKRLLLNRLRKEFEKL